MNNLNAAESTNSESKTYWQEQREYFKEKTLAFKELKKRRHTELMKKELEKELEKELNKNKKIDKD